MSTIYLSWQQHFKKKSFQHRQCNRTTKIQGWKIERSKLKKKKLLAERTIKRSGIQKTEDSDWCFINFFVDCVWYEIKKLEQAFLALNLTFSDILQQTGAAQTFGQFEMVSSDISEIAVNPYKNNFLMFFYFFFFGGVYFPIYTFQYFE